MAFQRHPHHPFQTFYSKSLSIQTFSFATTIDRYSLHAVEKDETENGSDGMDLTPVSIIQRSESSADMKEAGTAASKTGKNGKEVGGRFCDDASHKSHRCGQQRLY